MVLTVLKSFSPTGDSFIALKTELSKAIFPFKIALVATVNMFPPIAHTDTVELKDDQPVHNN